MKKDKARDIARGVLPSTDRKGAKGAKRAFHHRHRSAQRQVLHNMVRSITDVDEDGNFYADPDLYDDYDGPEVIAGYTAATQVPGPSWDRSMKHIVARRRDADNLGPLLSWARATEAKKMSGWDVEDKINYFKAILPDNLQGRHALGHVESALDLTTDEFYFGFSRYRNPPEPLTKDRFRGHVSRHLSTTKSRAALREAILDAVPVAAHTAPSNLKDKVREQARDENGDLRWLPDVEYDPVHKCDVHYVTRRPMMVSVLIPRTISVTCDDCSFLRNDPLATTEAVNRFVDIVWAARRAYPSWWDSRPIDHTFVREIFDYVNR